MKDFDNLVVGGCRCPAPCLAHPELTVANAPSLNELAPDELPPFWREVWREAQARIPDDTTRQSCFNDGAHFVINALQEAAKALVRLRKIDDEHDGPWEDEKAFQLFNRQITQAYHTTSERWAEIVGVETVDSMWAIPECEVCEAVSVLKKADMSGSGKDFSLKIGDRVRHQDGMEGTVEAFWVVWDDRIKRPLETGPFDASVLEKTAASRREG